MNRIIFCSRSRNTSEKCVVIVCLRPVNKLIHRIKSEWFLETGKKITEYAWYDFTKLFRLFPVYVHKFGLNLLNGSTFRESVNSTAQQKEMQILWISIMSSELSGSCQESFQVSTRFRSSKLIQILASQFVALMDFAKNANLTNLEFLSVN